MFDQLVVGHRVAVDDERSLRPIIKSSLDAGNIDVFAMDRSTLAGYMNETVELCLL